MGSTSESIKIPYLRVIGDRLPNKIFCDNWKKRELRELVTVGGEARLETSSGDEREQWSWVVFVVGKIDMSVPGSYGFVSGVGASTTELTLVDSAGSDTRSSPCSLASGSSGGMVDPP